MEDGKKSKKPVKKKAGRRKRDPNVKIPSLLDLPTVREKALAKFALTPDVWARQLKEELEATKVKVFMTKDGDIIHSEDFIDHKIRQEARRDLGEYLGMKPPEKSEMTVKGVKFIIED